MGKATASIQEQLGLIPAKTDEYGSELDGYTGYEGIDEDALIIPRVKIVQPTSKVGTAGTFLMNLTGEEWNEVQITVIKATRGRVLWDRDSDSDLPICRSYDFHVPDRSIESPINDICAEYKVKGGKKFLEAVCPYATWGEDGKRPACNENYNLLCLTSDGIPFWIAITGASLKPVRKYISAIALRRKKLWQFRTTMSLLAKTEPHKHFVVQFSPPVQISPEEMGMVVELVQAFKNETIETTLRAEEAAQEGGEGAAKPEWAKDDVPF